MILMQKRYRADYAKAVRVAAEVLEDYAVSQIPLQLEQILNALSNEIALMPYSALMAKHGLSLSDVIQRMDSDLGACVYNSQSAQYIIFYNDTLSEAWSRFTIAHELGHYFLEHHLHAGTDILGRTSIPERKYKEYENEANAFARNLLSPAPLAGLVTQSRSESVASDIAKAFFITSKAAETRIAFLKRDLSYCTAAMREMLLRIKIAAYPLVCEKCGYALPETAEFCPACGGDREEADASLQDAARSDSGRFVQFRANVPALRQHRA